MMESNNQGNNVITVKNEYLTQPEQQNGISKECLTSPVKSKYLNRIVFEESLTVTESELLLTNKQLAIPSIKKEIEYLEQPESTAELDRPVCVVSNVATVVKCEVNSDSEDVGIPAENNTLAVMKQMDVSSALDTEHNQRQNPKQSSSSNNPVSWEFVKSFKTYGEALLYIDQGQYWSLLQQFFSNDGLKNYYKCNQAGKNGLKCPAQINLLFHASSGNVLMCRSFDKHLPHIDIPKCLSERVKEEINKLHDLNLKLAAIMNNLARINDIVLPSITQVEDYLRHRKPKNLNATNNLNNDRKYIVGYGRKTNVLHQNNTAKSMHSENSGSEYEVTLMAEKSKPLLIEEFSCSSHNLKPSKFKSKRKKDTAHESENENDSHLESIGKRRNTKTWTLYKEFENEEAADDYISKEKCWSCERRLEQLRGLKVYYRCNEVRAKGPQCPVQIYIYHHLASGKSLLYRTAAEHKHDPDNMRQCDMSDKVKDTICKLHKQGLTATKIMQRLANMKNIRLPKIAQVKQHLQQLQTQNASDQDLNGLCIEVLESQPEKTKGKKTYHTRKRKRN